MTFDHWAYFLNSHLRQSAHQVIIEKNQEKKDALKKQIKEIDEKLFADLKDNNKYGSLSLIHVLFYSYLEPVKVMTNNNFKSYLPTLKQQYGWDTYEAFSSKGEAKKVLSTSLYLFIPSNIYL